MPRIKSLLIFALFALYTGLTVAWTWWLAPELMRISTTKTLLPALAGSGFLAFATYGLIIYIIKTARPTAGGGR
ncbi:hypothetical protein [Pseudomonas costantinii]|uniref:Uncharacterized protein n=1 Tax=Pseudomonas costantinii TaxID=168469 RepID=A0A1S2V3E7_9PSED|nr:hypothetical protein [Pseudomonas costantinii]OIN53243.1 hypothetical protein BFL40_10490 [Pseudomonas costantinii]SEE53403.1 hypothetical protein SAMN04515675_6080 [Pseudomonas costantinii]